MLTHADKHFYNVQGKNKAGGGVERINLKKNSLNMKLHESCGYISCVLLYAHDYVENTDKIQIWKYRTGTITSHKILCSLNKINTFCKDVFIRVH